jgi:hypothetical protein
LIPWLTFSNRQFWLGSLSIPFRGPITLSGHARA